MIDLPEIIEKNPKYLDNYIEIHQNTLNDFKKTKDYFDKTSSDYIISNDIYFEKQDILLLLNRTEVRLNGAKKYRFDRLNQPNKSSLYKTYFLLSLAHREHWYRTDVDSDIISLEVNKHLNKVKSLIESKPPSPNEESWEKIRKEYPSMMYDIVDNIEKAKNKLNHLININLKYDSRDYWETCRFFELYNIVDFDNDNEPISDPKSPFLTLHASDSFVKYEIDPSEFDEKQRHKNIMLNNMTTLREEAILYSRRFEQYLKSRKKITQKPN